MDQNEIQEWRNFCENSSRYTPDHFSSLFMELYLKPLTQKDKDDLRLIFSSVPNSTHALEKMLRLDESANSRSDDEITDLVIRDLDEMRKLLKSKDVLAVINSGAIEITSDVDRFNRTADCELNRQFFHEIASYFVKEIARHNGKIRALSNAFYGIANNIHLQWTLTADLLAVDAIFENYFELYLVGVDYAIGNNCILIMNYRAAAVHNS